MKHALCDAFCAGMDVVEVPAGFAVSTPFEGIAGEPLLFYAIGPNANGLWHLQDDGTTIPYIEASGADLENSVRSDTLKGMLKSYGAHYEERTCELRTDEMAFDKLPAAMPAFVNLLVRVQGLLETTREKAEAVWTKDALNELRNAIGDRAAVESSSYVSDALADWPADVIVRAAKRAPVAIFFGTTDAKAYQAMLLHTTARYQLHIPCAVVLLLENDRSLTAKVRQRADNSIIVPRYRGGEKQAIGRIAEEALGKHVLFH